MSECLISSATLDMAAEDAAKMADSAPTGSGKVGERISGNLRCKD